MIIKPHLHFLNTVRKEYVYRQPKSSRFFKLSLRLILGSLMQTKIIYDYETETIIYSKLYFIGVFERVVRRESSKF